MKRKNSRASLEVLAKIVEDFVNNPHLIHADLVKRHNVTGYTVTKAIEKYFQKGVKENTLLTSKM